MSCVIYWQVLSRHGTVLCDVGMKLTVEQARNTVENYRRRDGDDGAFCRPVFPMERGAIFSECEKYRYLLWRMFPTIFEPGYETRKIVNFLMLNPSKADAQKNDATVERCERRARMWGYDGMTVTNIAAWRSTNPDKLLKLEDPVGPENDAHILTWARSAAVVVCGWSSHEWVVKSGRGRKVEQLLRGAGIQPTVLKLNDDGNPGHPLYIGYKQNPQPWEASR